MFDLRQLRSFQAVAAERNFTRAAVVLNYAQSSVTAQVRGLEEDLGVPLFDRVARGVELTAAGRRFLIYADKLLELAAEARLTVHGDGAPAGPLTVSVSETLLTYRLSELLRTFQECYPAVQLSLRTSVHTTVEHPIAAGVDVALTIDELIEADQVVVRMLRPEPVVAAVRANHVLAKRSKVVASSLVDQQFLVTGASCSYRTLFERTLQSQGVRLSKVLEFPNIEAIKQCALAGMGVAILPEIVVQAELSQGCLVSLPWPNPRMQVFSQLIRPKGKWVSPVIEAFWTMAETLLASESSETMPKSFERVLDRERPGHARRT